MHAAQRGSEPYVSLAGYQLLVFVLVSVVAG
jgi:hypothetical protein